MFLIVKRLVFGLGSVSDLNGGFPWACGSRLTCWIGTGFACRRLGAGVGGIRP